MELIEKQQAIDAVTDELDTIDHVPQWVFDRFEERLKQLTPAQPEPCEDAVSRKDCLKALSNMMDTDGFRNGWAVSRANVEGMLKSMPSVTPKQRTGKWIPQDHNKRVGNISTCVYCYPTCSECGKVGIETYKYCPHCGAKMTEGDAE